MPGSIDIEIPTQLKLLCELLEINPQQLLQGFINDLSLEVYGSHGSDERRMAGEYFMRAGYGMHCYSFDDVEEMFDELNSLRLQWPGSVDRKKENEYHRHRERYLIQWHKRWNQRKNISKNGG